MPIYEYHCKKCNHTFEVWQKMSDRAPKCEKCSGKVDKLTSLSGFQLKGGGWYADGYTGGSKEKSKEGSSKKKSEPAAPAKSDSKSTKSQAA